MTKDEFINELAAASNTVDDRFNATGNTVGFVLVAFAKSENGFMCTCTSNASAREARAALELILENIDAGEPVVGHA
jgi:hypothetical protein